MLPIASDIAVRLTREQAQSALPDAPVVTDVPPVPTAGEVRRIRLAGVLRRLADRLEPAPGSRLGTDGA